MSHKSEFLIGSFVFLLLLGIVSSVYYADDDEHGLGVYNKTNFDWLDARIGNFTEVKSENGSFAEHIFGPTIEGNIGSGVIWCDDIDENGNVGLTHTLGETELRYPNMTVRLVKTDNTVKYCNITSAWVTPTDDQHSVYYIDSDCAVQSVTFTAYVATDLSPGGLADIFNVMRHAGEIESHKGVTVKNKEDIKVRKAVLKTAHLRTVSGLGITTETFPNFTIAEGEYQYIREVVNASEQNITRGDTLELVYRVGGTWTFLETKDGINLTDCDDGTDTAPCSTPSKYRRHFIFIIGFADDEDHTELHQLLADEDITYARVGDCLNTVVSPLIFPMPDVFEYAKVMIWAYCGRGSDSSWSGSFIDMRAIQVGSASTDIDTSIFLTRDGTRTLTANWNIGDFNISGTGYSNLIHNFSFYNVPASLTDCGIVSFGELDGTVTCTVFVPNSTAWEEFINKSGETGSWSWNTTGTGGAANIIASSETTSPIYYFPNRQNSIQSEYPDTEDVKHYSQGDIIFTVGIGAGVYTFGNTELDLGSDNLKTTASLTDGTNYLTIAQIRNERINTSGKKGSYAINTTGPVTGSAITGTTFNGMAVSTAASSFTLFTTGGDDFKFLKNVIPFGWSITQPAISGITLNVRASSALDQPLLKASNVTHHDLDLTGDLTVGQFIGVDGDSNVIEVLQNRVNLNGFFKVYGGVSTTGGYYDFAGSTTVYIQSTNAGTVTLTLRNPGAGDMNVVVGGNMTADYYFGNGSFLDMTPSFLGTPEEAHDLIKNIKTIDGQIDHSTLPEFARMTVNATWEECNKEGKNCINKSEIREYRDLGAMITLLVKDSKWIDSEIQMLKDRITALESAKEV